MIFTNINYFLFITTFLFFLGVFGLVLNRKNILITIMSIEIMLLAINLNFIIFSVYFDDILGQLFVLFVLTVAAAESSIGLALLLSYYRIKGDINIDNIKTIKK